MRNLPVLFVAGTAFCLSGLVMVALQVAGGFLMIPLGGAILARAFYLSRKISRRPH